MDEQRTYAILFAATILASTNSTIGKQFIQQSDRGNPRSAADSRAIAACMEPEGTRAWVR